MPLLRPVAQGAITLADTDAHPLSATAVQCRQLLLQNDDGADPNGNTGIVSLGNEDVTASTGAVLRPGAGLILDCGNPASIYALTTSAPTTLRWTAFG